MKRFDPTKPTQGASAGQRVVRGVLALLVGMLVLLPTLLNSAADARTVVGPSFPTRALGTGSRIPWQGQSWYLQGANVPWLNWAADFGGGTDGGGVSSASSQAALKAGFQAAKASGANVIRWWVFEGDPWQIRRDGAGAPTSLDPAVYPDFDAAVELAATYDLYLDFVLFSGPGSLPSSWLTNSGQRAQLASALEPLFARYASNPRVMTWEVFNEPDFDVWNGAVEEADMRAAVQAIATAVHNRSSAYVTLGMGMLDGLSMATGLGLDYYQAHWYDYMSSGNYCARCRTYADVRDWAHLDAPLVIGELYAGPDVDSLQRLEDFYANGYAGTWPWSIFPDATSDHLHVDFAAVQAFSSRHADLGPRGSGTPPGPPPPSGATVTQTPTATATNTVVTGIGTATATTTATATETATPISVATATLTATLPPTATFTPSPCSPRPPISISTTQASGGRLNVTVSVTGANNAIAEIRFGTASNAVIDLPDGRNGLTGGVTYRPATRQTRISFVVRRAASGGGTVPFTVVDNCGPWQTFVGGGRDVGF